MIVLKQLEKLWPGAERGNSEHSSPRRNLPKWRQEAPLPPPSEFRIGIPRSKLRRLLAEFKNNQCLYPNAGGRSCADVSKETESRYSECGRKLRRLMRKRLWTRTDLDQIFDIAHTNGRQAKLWKPLFLRQRPSRVAATLAYLQGIRRSLRSIREGPDEEWPLSAPRPRRSRYQLSNASLVADGLCRSQRSG